MSRGKNKEDALWASSLAFFLTFWNANDFEERDTEMPYGVSLTNKYDPNCIKICVCKKDS